MHYQLLQRATDVRAPRCGTQLTDGPAASAAAVILVSCGHNKGRLYVKMLKTDLYSAIKSEDSEALDSETSQLGSQRGFGGIEMF